MLKRSRISMKTQRRNSIQKTMKFCYRNITTRQMKVIKCWYNENTIKKNNQIK